MENTLTALYVVVASLGNLTRLTTLGLRAPHFGPDVADVASDYVADYVNGVADEAAGYGRPVYLVRVPEGFRYRASWENQNRHEIVNRATGETKEVAGDLVFVAR